MQCCSKCLYIVSAFRIVLHSSINMCTHSFQTTDIPFPNKPWFLRVCSISLLKTLWEKEKLLVSSNFSFSHSVFYPFEELFAIFIKVRIFCLQTLSVWKSLKFVVWERDISEFRISDHRDFSGRRLH